MAISERSSRTMTPEDLIVAVAKWSERDDRVLAAAVCGSYARGTATAASDIDICLICSDACFLLDELSWVDQFGVGQAGDQEDYGLVQSVRVHYDHGLEVEFGISGQEWMQLPIDSDTARVMREGLRIIFDPQGQLRRALASVVAE